MFIEGLYLKYIKIKNLSDESKQLYIILHIKQTNYVSSLIFLRSNQLTTYSWASQRIKFQQKDQIQISFWNYDQIKLFKKIHLLGQKMVTANYSKILILPYELQFFCEPIKQTNLNQALKQSQQEHFNIRQQFLSSKITRNANIKVYPNSNIFNNQKALHFRNYQEMKIYKSLQHLSDKSLVQTSYSKKFFNPKQNIINKEKQQDNNETSLQKRANDDYAKPLNRSSSLLDLIQNRKTVPNSISFFDDYQANRKQKSIFVRHHQQKSIDKEQILQFKRKQNDLGPKIDLKIVAKSKKQKVKSKFKDSSDKYSTSQSGYMQKRILKNAINKLVQNRIPKQEYQKNTQIMQPKDYQNIQEVKKIGKLEKDSVSMEIIEYGLNNSRIKNRNRHKKQQFIEQKNHQKNSQSADKVKIKTFNFLRTPQLKSPRQHSSSSSLKKSIGKDKKSLQKCQSTRSNSKINKLQKNISKIYKNMNKIYEKDLTKNQIEIISKLNSFDLSQSIYELYGLDLSKDFLKHFKMIQKRQYQRDNNLLNRNKSNLLNKISQQKQKQGIKGNIQDENIRKKSIYQKKRSKQRSFNKQKSYTQKSQKFDKIQQFQQYGS